MGGRWGGRWAGDGREVGGRHCCTASSSPRRATARPSKARAFLEPVKRKFPGISYSDLWVLAAYVGIEHTGAPARAVKRSREEAPFTARRVNRRAVDCLSARPGRLGGRARAARWRLVQPDAAGRARQAAWRREVRRVRLCRRGGQACPAELLK